MVRSTEYYDILGVSPNSTQGQISKAFRRLVALKHPDKNPNASVEEFEKINKAYHVLKDPETRAQYDRLGPDYSSGMGSTSGFDVADDMFGFFDSFLGGSQRVARNRQPTKSDFNIEIELYANLEDVYRGTEKTVIYNRRDYCDGCNSTGSKSKNKTKCSTCNGNKKVREAKRLSNIMIQEVVVDCPTCKARGFVIADDDKCDKCKGLAYIKHKETVKKKIEIGDHDNRKYYFKDMGHNSLSDKNLYGDLVLQLKIKPNKYYIRVHNDLYLHVCISYIEALFGFSRQINHISGQKLMICHSSNDSPIVTKSVRTIENYGMPIMGRPNKFGSLNLVFDVEYPTKSACSALSHEERIQIAEKLTPVASKKLMSNSLLAPLRLSQNSDEFRKEHNYDIDMPNKNVNNGNDSNHKVLKLTDGDMLSSQSHKAAFEAYSRAEAHVVDSKHLGPSYFYYLLYKNSLKNPGRVLNIEDFSFTDSEDEQETKNKQKTNNNSNDNDDASQHIQHHDDSDDDIDDDKNNNKNDPNSRSSYNSHSGDDSHHAQNVQCQSH